MSDQDALTRFEELVGEEGLEAQVGVQQKGNWIDRMQLVPDGDPDSYVVDADQMGQPRYTVVTEDGDARVNARERFVFPVKRLAGSDESVDDDVAIVVDVSTTEDMLPDTVPWASLSEFQISSDVLKRDSGFDTVSADRVAGLEMEKDRLQQFLRESDEDWGLAEPTGIILEGPPGTGKTELVMEVCQERYGSIPVMISGPEILSKWVGESERLLRETFEEAWDTEHKMLYIDELDAIAQSRSDVSESHSAQIVAQLLVLLDGVATKQQADEMERSLKVVTSTNLSHVVDPALRRPGRLGNRPIQFSHPMSVERQAILHHYLENVYASDDGQLSEELWRFVERGDDEIASIGSLVKETDGFTGADIEDLIQASVRKLRESRKEQLDRDLIETVLRDDDFEQGREFSETILSVNSGDMASSMDVDQSQPGLVELDGDEPDDVACRYFSTVDASAEGEFTYKLRVVSPTDILASDMVRAKEDTVQAFQHRENERIALFLKNTNLLLEAQEQSSLVDRLIGVIHEQFIQWEHDNVLILSSTGDDVLLDVT